MTIFLSPFTDPDLNFAAEARLQEEGRGDFAMVYINDPCVVIGRNQIAGAEADAGFCRDNGIRIIRRSSGGGAVYHDHGNVNFSFIRSVNSPLAESLRDLSLVVDILAQIGVKTTIGPRKELLAGGKKISGTACFCRRGRYIFHGTLLYDSDMDKLGKSLSGDVSLRGRKTASVPSPVTNIRAVVPGNLTAREFARVFAETMSRLTHGTVMYSFPE